MTVKETLVSMTTRRKQENLINEEFPLSSGYNRLKREYTPIMTGIFS